MSVSGNSEENEVRYSLRLDTILGGVLVIAAVVAGLVFWPPDLFVPDVPQYYVVEQGDVALFAMFTQAPKECLFQISKETPDYAQRAGVRWISRRLSDELRKACRGPR